MLRPPIFLLRLLLLLLILPLQLAVASVTTGTIKGTTVDDTDLPIPGVLVSIKSPQMMGVKQVETDAEGRFFFAELPPGMYEVIAEKAGFTKVTRKDQEVLIGRNTILTVKMPLASQGAELVVEGQRASIDTESTSRSTVLSKDFLERIPSGRSYQGAVQMAAGVTGGGNPNVGGASSNENTYMLDGVNITDPVTGTFSLNFNFDAIEQIEVLTSAFDPEYGVNLGGVINLATVSGGNTLEFSTSGYYINGNWSPKLDARVATDGLTIGPTDFDSNFQIMQFYAQISGPIIRDKMWFVTSYAHERSLIAFSGIDLPRDYDGNYLFGKLTWQPVAAHKFAMLFQTNPTSIDNTNQSDRYVEPEAQGRQAQGGYVLSAQWQWFPLANASLESKNTLQKNWIEASQVACTHDKGLGYNPCASDELEGTIDYETPGRLGTNLAYDSDNYPAFVFDDRYTFSSGNKFSLLQVEFLGTHDFKAGAEVDLRWRDYTFAYTGNSYYVDLNEAYYDPDTLKNYYWYEWSGPLQYTQRSRALGLFIQDAWKPISNLTVRYGVRYDRSSIDNDVGDNIVNVGLWGPRLGVSWDPWGDAKTKFIGSVGRFNDTSRLGITSLVNRTGMGYKLFLGEIYDGFSNTASDDYYYVPAENTDTYVDNLIAPHSDDFVLGAEREIVQDLVARLYFQAKFTQNLFEDDETNVVWDEDGYNALGSTDSTGLQYYRLRTPDIARRTYYQVEIGLTKRFSDRWGVQGNYTYSRSRGTTLGQVSSFLDVAPQNAYYENGLLATDIIHDASVGAVWDLPWEPWTTTLGSTFSYEAGSPQSQYYDSAYFGGAALLRDTLGTYAREESAWNLSVRAQQAIPVRKGKLSGIVEISNITNNRQGLNTSAGGGSASIYNDRWYISYRQNPMRITVGAEYEF